MTLRSTGRRTGPIPRVAVGLLLLVFATLAWHGRQRGPLAGGDDSVYVALSQSIEQFEYRNVFELSEPPHVQYPPGYPTLLAAWAAGFGSSYEAWVGLSIVMMLGALALTYGAIQNLAGWQFALLCLTPLAVNPHLLHAGRSVLTEAPALFCVALALWALTRSDWKPRHAVAATASLATVAIRFATVALPIALILHWIRSRRFLWAGILAAGLGLSLASWQLRALLAETHSAEAYIEQIRLASESEAGFREQATWFVNKVISYSTSGLPDALAIPLVPGTWIDNLLVTIVAWGCGGVGVVLLWRRFPLPVLYIAISGLALAVWPWSDTRLLVPLVIVLVPVLLWGVFRVSLRIGPRWAVALTGAVAAVMTINGAFHSVEAASCDESLFTAPPECIPPGERAFGQAMKYADEATDPDESVLTPRGAIFYLYSGRPTLTWESFINQDASGFARLAREWGVSHVIVTDIYWIGDRHYRAFLRRVCGVLRVSASFPPHALVLEVIRQTSASGDACDSVNAYLERHPRPD